jgi:ABC-2 type transport system ATP-binding protein
MEPILELKNLSKRYKGFTLKGVNLVVPRGYIMGLIGPNGAGKTTIIKLIMNLVRRDGGEIEVFGLDNLAHEAAIKSRIGFVYEEPCFHHDVKLKDIRSAVAPFYEKWNEERFTALISEFGLPLNKKFKKLSEGMKSKFAIALALSHDAELIVMDEPTSGLDPIFRRELLERLSDFIQDENKSVLFSTHITSDLEKTADYVTFIHDGEIRFSTRKDDLLERWGIVKGGPELLARRDNGLFLGVCESAYGVEALTTDIETARRELGGDLVFERATLEEIMVFIGQGERHD